MKFTFILNPNAGGFASRRRRAHLLDALPSTGFEYDVEFTEHRRHALLLARSAAEKGRAVIAVGGDGTAHEVASGIIESGANVPMAVIPGGTGNDFAKMLDLPDSDSAILKLLGEGHTQPVDYGRVTWTGPDSDGTGYFINICGTGFDAKVAAAASRFKWLSGTPRYAAAVLRTLVSWHAPNVDLILSRSGRTVHAFHGPLFLALVGNGVCSGGGFYLTPHASIQDGMLDACVIRDVSVGRVLSLMPKALRGGHAGAAEVRLEKIERMDVTMDDPVPVQADGEILTERATKIEIVLVPSGLRMLLPVKT